ncbi:MULTISPECIES: hypothetical protein [Methylobacterium]|uniref:hypothetical protein n=1 Tax=Methylobacterium TaxID=407 RepID=UPI0010516A0A|nr:MULTISPECIES: hypothetical protein [Methylobacterium]MDR7035982.1 hypothetical protein [Methylobacterium sp. BE186]
MRQHTKFRSALVAAAVLVGWASAASADCTRRIYNRSAYVLVVSQDGGPPISLRPGSSAPVRLSRPGTLDLSVQCSAYGGGAEPVARTQFTYQALLDRCYVEFGTQFFVAALGRGFFGTQGTSPFTVNNPRQGDVVLGPFAASCPALSRRG